MQLACDWSRLVAQLPAGLSSQGQAFKALAEIVREDGPRATEGEGADASAKGAARCAFGGKPARTGPVWRESGPFVKEAWRLMSSVDEALARLVSRGYPLAPGADKVH